MLSTCHNIELPRRSPEGGREGGRHTTPGRPSRLHHRHRGTAPACRAHRRCRASATKRLEVSVEKWCPATPHSARRPVAAGGRPAGHPGPAPPAGGRRCPGPLGREAAELWSAGQRLECAPREHTRQCLHTYGPLRQFVHFGWEV